MRKARKHPLLVALLYIAAALALAVAPWAVSRVQAADQRSSSGSSRPIMPGNQPAGTGLNQPTPGSTMAPNARPPAPAAPPQREAPPTSVPQPGASPMQGQGTVQGSSGSPGAIGDPAGGTAGTRGQKDNRRGH